MDCILKLTVFLENLLKGLISGGASDSLNLALQYIYQQFYAGHIA